MPRPIRIEYNNAFYHVMNRGRARNNIFFKEIHYLTFLKVLEEVCERFGIIIHAYCLMPNHYHLLIETPNANLSRAVRHINAVYVQKFNKLQKIDGPLFRGRYKAILVEEDEYLLELSKYIHRNPIQTKNKENRLVNKLEEYKWSSYPDYLNSTHKTNKWLNKELTLSKFKNDKDLIRRYQLFVEREENKELEEFFNKKNQDAIMGKTEFKEQILINKLINQKEKQEKIKKEIRSQLTTEEIINAVSTVFNVSKLSITTRQKIRKKDNPSRRMSIYLLQKYKDLNLIDIIEIFELNNIGSANCHLSKIKKELSNKLYTLELEKINNILNL